MRRRAPQEQSQLCNMVANSLAAHNWLPEVLLDLQEITTAKMLNGTDEEIIRASREHAGILVAIGYIQSLADEVSHPIPTAANDESINIESMNS